MEVEANCQLRRKFASRVRQRDMQRYGTTTDRFAQELFTQSYSLIIFIQISISKVLCIVMLEGVIFGYSAR